MLEERRQRRLGFFVVAISLIIAFSFVFSMISVRGASFREVSLSQEEFNFPSEGIISQTSFQEGGDTTLVRQTYFQSQDGLMNLPSAVLSDQADLSRGYLVEFEETPLAVKDAESRDELQRNKEYLERASVLNPRRAYVQYFGVTSEEDVREDVRKQQSRIASEHERMKQKILLSVGNQQETQGFVANVIRAFTGRAVDGGNKDVQLSGEYENVFNGIALNISAEEAENIKKIKGVKSVEPNTRVELFVQDAAKIVGAVDAWKLDTSGDACITSGEECLTGKGVTIAVLDTGVDYTHADLGNGCFKPGEMPAADCKIAGGYDFSGDDVDEEDNPLPDADPMDTHGHGTHVAATAAGKASTVAKDLRVPAYTEGEALHLGDYFSVSSGDDAEIKYLFKVNDMQLLSEEGALMLVFEDVRSHIFWQTEVSADGTGILGNIPGFEGSYFIQSTKMQFSKNLEIRLTWGSGASFGSAGTVRSQMAEIVLPGQGGDGGLNGIAPDAQILAYKIFPNAYNSVILAAFEKVADPNGDKNFEDHADIASMSFGGSGNPDDAISTAVDSLVKVGVVAVVAAGNDGPTGQTIGSPGTARKAITVGAIDKQEHLAPFSSRGPVVWKDKDGNEQYLMKPDVVAPGVEICAARLPSFKPWESSPQYALCNGDETHVLLSGTSMATPVVSGAVALLKQAHPEWTPEEIQTSLRSTAFDLRDFVTSQGQGSIDVSQAIALKDISLFATIGTSSVVDGKIVVKGTAKGIDFSHYTLFYRSLSDNIEQILCSGNAAVEDGTLCSVDLFPVDDGESVLRLEVSGTSDEIAEDFSLISFNNFELIGAGNNFYLRGKTDILGEVRFNSYERVGIEIEDAEKKSGWSEFCSSTSVQGTLICTGDAAALQDGLYHLRIFVVIQGTRVFGKVASVRVFKDLFAGYPLRVSDSSVPALLNYRAVPFSDTGKNSMLLSHSKFCHSIGGGWFSCSNQADYELISPEGSVQMFGSQFTDSQKSFTFKNGNLPSVISSVNGQESYLLVSPFEKEELGGALVDAQGKARVTFEPLPSRGEVTFYSEGDFVSTPFGMFEIIRSSSKTSWGIAGYNLEGTFLEGYPVSFSVPEGKTLRSFPYVRVLEEADTAHVAVVYSLEDTRENFDDPQNIELYTRIYSLDGTLEKEVLLFKKERVSHFSYSVPAVISTDTNLDGKQDLIVAFSFFDIGDYYSQMDNVQESKVFSISSQGEVVELYNSQEFSINQIVAGEFQGNLGLVAILESTSTPSLALFDGAGKVIFEREILDFYKRPLSLTLADLNGDGASEILVSYVYRFWEKSGVAVYNAQGVLLRDISFNPLGTSDMLTPSSAPFVFDFNQDGKLDFVQLLNQMTTTSRRGPFFETSDELFLYAFTLGEMPSLNADWPMDMHDAQHTGCFGCEPLRVSLGSNPPSTPICGNGVQEGKEACDAGTQNGACPATCNLSCGWNFCDSSGRDAGNISNESNSPSSPITHEVLCEDLESRDDLTLQGKVYSKGVAYIDKCEEQGKSVREYFCEEDKLRSFVKRCPSGTLCRQGACQ